MPPLAIQFADHVVCALRCKSREQCVKIVWTSLLEKDIVKIHTTNTQEQLFKNVVINLSASFGGKCLN